MKCTNPKFIPKAGFATGCGKCYPCLKKRVNDWSCRLYIETMHTNVKPLFVTLTYNNENLKKPHPRAMYASLCKRDLQLFFKRLRKRNTTKEKIRYLAVGEYGTQNRRPHYHLILFGTLPDLVQESWKDAGSEIGQVYFGDVTPRSIGYCAGYCLQDKTHRKHVLEHNLQPQFHLFSNSIGALYATGTAVYMHNRALVERHFVTLDGQRYAMPRYLMNKIYTPTNKQILKQQLKEKHEKESSKPYSARVSEIRKRESDRNLSKKTKERAFV